MPKIHPKSEAVVQAQIATFVAEDIGRNDYNGQVVLENIGDIAVGGLTDVTRTVKKKELVHDWQTNMPVEVPLGTVVPVASKDEYVSYLRSVGGAEYNPIKGRAEILAAYDRFEPAVAELKSEVDELDRANTHPDHLGSGGNSSVMSLEVGGKKYAVRLSGRADGDSSCTVDSHISGAVLAKGIPHTEQIVAASYKDGVTVAEILPGAEVKDLKADDISRITDEQFGELVDTLAALQEHDLLLDPNPSNFLYDPQAGFGIVDIHSARDINESRGQSLGQKVGWVSNVIVNSGINNFFKPNRFEPKTTPQEYTDELVYRRVYLETLNRYKNIVKEKLKGDDLDVALDLINEQIQSEEEAVKQYADPEWVSTTIAKDKARAAERRKQVKQTKKATTTQDGYSAVAVDRVG